MNTTRSVQKQAVRAMVLLVPLLAFVLALSSAADVSARESTLQPTPAEVGVETACQVRIMPLGDSITEGKLGSTEDVGYRRSLYLSLRSLGYDVDFVGGGKLGVPDDFDKDHEGHAGKTADFIRDNVKGYLAQNPADFVLLAIGTNDITYDQTAEDIRDEIAGILDKIREFNPGISVVLAKIVNRKANADQISETTALNVLIQELAEDRGLAVVDLESALTYPSDLDDNVHPNDAGYEKIADEWLGVLAGALSTFCPTSAADRFASLVGTKLTIDAPGVLANDLQASGRPAANLMIRFPGGAERLCTLVENPSGQGWDWPGLENCTTCGENRNCNGAFTTVAAEGGPISYFVREKDSRVELASFSLTGPIENILTGVDASPVSRDSSLASTTTNGTPRLYYLSPLNTVQEIAFYQDQWHHRYAAFEASAPSAIARSPLTAISTVNNDPRVYYLAEVDGALHVQELALTNGVWHHTDVNMVTGAPDIPSLSPLVTTTSNLEPRVYYMANVNNSTEVYELALRAGKWHWSRLVDVPVLNHSWALAATSVGGLPLVYYLIDGDVHELAWNGASWASENVSLTSGATDVWGSALATTTVNNEPRVYFMASGDYNWQAQGNRQNIHELAKFGGVWRHVDMTSEFSRWLLNTDAETALNALTSYPPRLTAEPVRDVQHGSLIFRSNGSFEYTPDQGFIGTDSFSYRALNGSRTTAETWVELSVIACTPVPGNIVLNSCFEGTSTPWRYYRRPQDGHYSLTTDDPFEGYSSAEIFVAQKATNIQFYQQDLHLEPDTMYELSFAARSNNGNDLSVWVHEDTSKNPKNYGLKNHRVNLTKQWKTFETTFKTPADLPTDSNARLRFYLRGVPSGTVFYLDNIVLKPVNQ